TRSEANKIVESEGGEATSSVSSDTDFVVCGEKPGSKFDEAQKKGIKILTEEEFRKLTNLPNPE
ncbi:MAG: BRCT domain-containing protein, partial [Candidatus Omnitrophota bacterium]